MSDNVAITAGSGTSIATDDVSGAHFQKIKLFAASDGDERRLDRDEDAAHSSGDPGVPALGVRRDTPTAGAGSDGDYALPGISADGALWTAAGWKVATLAVTTGDETTTVTGLTGYTGVYLSASDGLEQFYFTFLCLRDGVSVGARGYALANGSLYTSSQNFGSDNEAEVTNGVASIWVPLLGADSFEVTGDSVGYLIAGGTLNMVFVRSEPPLRSQFTTRSGFWPGDATRVDGLPVAVIEPEVDVNDIALASSATNAELVAASTSRIGLMVTNTDANTLYLRYGNTAATTSAFTVQVPAGASWEMPQPIYRGAIQAIWAANGSGSAIGAELVAD